ncbi:hypothetical protein [Streptomyces nigrescens]|uniref:hypothetical protein n=1 Tax=Streptomyces nigrescens TaxID=1920 RepID=UPI0021C3D21A|nr:hypothetical protein [Streptomyces nigrescens]
MANVHDLLGWDVGGVVNGDAVAVQTEMDTEEVEDKFPSGAGRGRRGNVDARNDQRRMAESADVLELGAGPDPGSLHDREVSGFVR